MLELTYDPTRTFKHYQDDGMDYLPVILYRMNRNRMISNGVYQQMPEPVKVTEPVKSKPLQRRLKKVKPLAWNESVYSEVTEC